ncbi:MAG: hypothetical protein U0Y96_04690 [Candidatus Kapaibacterium sp.]
MAWESKYYNYGVVKIDGNNVKVYYDQSNYITIYVNEQITQVSWAGGELNVSLANGNVRRYSDQSNYTTIY